MSFSKVLLRSTIASALILSGVAAEAGLDLTATANEYVAEGMKHVQLNFRYDKDHAEYEPPPTSTFAGVAAEAGLDRTATANEYVAEGMKHVQLNFRYDKDHAEYEPPPTWTFAGSKNQLRLTPPKKFAEAIITVAPTNKPSAYFFGGVRRN